MTDSLVTLFYLLPPDGISRCHLAVESFLWKGLANPKFYGTITIPWSGIRISLWDGGSGLPMLELRQEINGRGKYNCFSGGWLRKWVWKPPSNQVNTNSENWNSKWSWIWRSPEIGRENRWKGCSILRPHFWPIRWPIRGQHGVGTAVRNGLRPPGFSWKRAKSPTAATQNTDFSSS